MSPCWFSRDQPVAHPSYHGGVPGEAVVGGRGALVVEPNHSDWLHAPFDPSIGTVERVGWLWKSSVNMFTFASRAAMSITGMLLA